MKLLQAIVDFVSGDGDISLGYVFLLPFLGKDKLQECNHDWLGGLAMGDEKEVTCRRGWIFPFCDDLD